MKVRELREKSIEELKKEHLELLRGQFNLRMQKTMGQLARPHELKLMRRDAARVLTLIKEKMGTEA